jgi:outer membrane protein assembly factor BamA
MHEAATMGAAHRRATPSRLLGLFAAAIALSTSRARAQDEPVLPKTEFGAVPVLGGDSDVGFGGGALASLTWLEPGFRPYRRRLEVGGIATFKHRFNQWEVPYQDYYFLWIDPHLIRNRLRLEFRPSYTNEAYQLYYGIGNASVAPPRAPGEAVQRYFQYGRMHPTVLARVRATLGGGFYALTGVALTLNRLDIHAPSKVLFDASGAAGPLLSSFGTLADHAVLLFEYGLVFDTRDDETSPQSGANHQLKLRLSPGGSEAFPYRYGQLNLTARFYVTPIPRWLTFAMRAVGDAQFGDPPFYELARFEDTFAVGGGRGVRGVPAQRYYGKIKALGNFETRTNVAFLRIGSKDYALGLVAFIDAGRVWSDWAYHPELDGTGIGLKWGVGGGIRFQQGTAFVVRADVAWSPDARPLGAYFTAGQIF